MPAILAYALYGRGGGRVSASTAALIVPATGAFYDRRSGFLCRYRSDVEPPSALGDVFSVPSGLPVQYRVQHSLAITAITHTGRVIFKIWFDEMTERTTTAVWRTRSGLCRTSQVRICGSNFPPLCTYILKQSAITSNNWPSYSVNF